MSKLIGSNLLFIAVFIYLFTAQSTILACPRCNQTFYDELLGPRTNTLGGQELLQAIRNQSVSGQPSSFDLLSTNDPLADTQEQDSKLTQVTDQISGDQTSSTPAYLPLINILAQLLFLGHL